MSEKALEWLKANPNHEKADLVRNALKEKKIDIPFERQIVDEAHPAVSWKDRTLVKNLAQGSGLGYLQKKYPNLQVEQDADGNVIMKGKNEEKWRKLDPSSLELADVSDIAYDIGAGTVEGLAAAGGALLGNVPGAMAAAGTSATALEALRQKIGQQVGVNEEMDPSQIAAAGIGSALLTPLAGVGKVSQGLRSKIGKALGKDLGEKGVSELAEKGVLKKGYERFTRGALPNIAEVTSGEKAKVFKDYVSNLEKMNEWRDNPELFEQAIFKSGKDFENAIDTNLKQAGKEMQALINTSGEDLRVDLTEITSEIDSAIQELRKSDFPTDVQLADRMQSAFDEIFVKKAPKEGKAERVIRDFVPFEEARKIRNLFMKYNNAFKKNMTGDPLNNDMIKFANEGYSKISSAIDDALDFADEGKGEAFKNARNRYREALATEQLLKKFQTVDKNTGLTDYSKTFDSLRTLNNPSKAMFKRAVEKINPDIVRQADLVQAFHRMSDPSFFPTSGTATSTSRTLAMGTLGAGLGQMSNEGGMGGGPGTVVGVGMGLLGLGPKAWRFYLSQGKRGENFLKSKFKQAGQKVPNNLKEHFNKQMAAQSIWGTMQSKSGQENDKK